MKNGQDQINICGYENDAIVYAEVREWKVQQIFFAEWNLDWLDESLYVRQGWNNNTSSFND